MARLGGDEFVIILEEMSGIQDVAGVAQKLIHALEQPVMLERQEVFATTSIGISVYPDDGDNADTLIKHADTAMYRAKERGRNNCQFYTADMNERALERLTMENSLRHALERNEFLLYYQPQVDLQNPQHHRHGGAAALAAPGFRAGCSRPASSPSPRKPA